VQRCRDDWKKAIIDCPDIVPATGGGRENRFAYEERWDEPVSKEKFDSIVAQIAVAGDKLFKLIFERERSLQLDYVAGKLRSVTCSGERAFTVEATDFHIPWGMIYTHPGGNELDKDGRNFDPRGFWGYQRIFEQFTNDFELTDRIAPVNGTLSFGSAIDRHIESICKAPCVAQHRAFFTRFAEWVRYAEWGTKSEVEAAFMTTPFEQQVVYFFCHAEGDSEGAPATHTVAHMHIADEKIDASDVLYWISERFRDNQPLIFLNACFAGQLSTLAFRNYTLASQFLERGAACVVGPQIEVPIVFGTEFAHRFFQEFLHKCTPSPKVGPLLRFLSRFFWERRNPLGLVYSLYAGGDCHIDWSTIKEIDTDGSSDGRKI
jgi:hypothetical protein